jgi:hypothetical protein
MRSDSANTKQCRGLAFQKCAFVAKQKAASLPLGVLIQLIHDSVELEAHILKVVLIHRNLPSDIVMRVRHQVHIDFVWHDLVGGFIFISRWRHRFRNCGMSAHKDSKNEQPVNGAHRAADDFGWSNLVERSACRPRLNQQGLGVPFG